MIRIPVKQPLWWKVRVFFVAHLKRNHFKRKIVFQPSFFRGHVSFRGSVPLAKCHWYMKCLTLENERNLEDNLYKGIPFQTSGLLLWFGKNKKQCKRPSATEPRWVLNWKWYSPLQVRAVLYNGFGKWRRNSWYDWLELPSQGFQTQSRILIESIHVMQSQLVSPSLETHPHINKRYNLNWAHGGFSVLNRRGFCPHFFTSTPSYCILFGSQKMIWKFPSPWRIHLYTVVNL